MIKLKPLLTESFRFGDRIKINYPNASKLMDDDMKQSIIQAYKYPGFEGFDRYKPFTVTGTAKVAQIQNLIDELLRFAKNQGGDVYYPAYRMALAKALKSLLIKYFKSYQLR